MTGLWRIRHWASMLVMMADRLIILRAGRCLASVEDVRVMIYRAKRCLASGSEGMREAEERKEPFDIS